MTRTGGGGLLEISGSRFIEEFFFVFVNMGPYGSENFQTLLLLQIAAENFQTFPECSSQWSSQNYVWDFEILKIEILMIFFRCP